MSEPAWVPLGPAAVLDVGPEVAYQEFTDKSITATTEAGADIVVTAPTFMADGSSAYIIDFFTPLVTRVVQKNPNIQFYLFMDGVSIGSLGYEADQISAGGESTFGYMPFRLTRRLVPAAGARTFSVRARSSSSTGSIVVGGGAGGVGNYVPGFIRITKVPSAVSGPSGLVPPTAIGTALPASPVDGQEFILTDSLTAPTYTWRLRYVAAKASNRWMFLGGSPLEAINDAAATTNSASYVDLPSSAGPSITIPVAGDYTIELNTYAECSGALAVGFMSYAVGATAASDSDAILLVGNSQNEGSSLARNRRKNIPAGGTVLAAKHRCAAGSVQFYSRRIAAVPAFIGG